MGPQAGLTHALGEQTYRRGRRDTLSDEARKREYAAPGEAVKNDYYVSEAEKNRAQAQGKGAWAPKAAGGGGGDGIKDPKAYHAAVTEFNTLAAQYDPRNPDRAIESQMRLAQIKMAGAMGRPTTTFGKGGLGAPEAPQQMVDVEVPSPNGSGTVKMPPLKRTAISFAA